MYLKQTKLNNGRVHLQIKRKFRELGKTKETTVLVIGYLDEVDPSIIDPISYYKQLAMDMTRNEKSLHSPISLVCDPKELVDSSLSYSKNLGYAFLQSEYYNLGLKEFFKTKQDSLSIDYNINNICRLLTFERILNPGSKKAAFDNSDYYFDNLTPPSIDSIYDMLSRTSNWKEELQVLLHSRITSLYGRNDDTAYFDCTNYYFEIDKEDSLRKKGPSKEHRKSPIVQMGLLMDTNGIPMTYHLFPGNESEKVNLLPVLKRCKRQYQLGRIVVVADKGLNTSDNIFYTHGKKDGYIYSQSIKGADKKYRDWALDSKGFTSLTKHKETIIDTDNNEVVDAFKIKSRIIGKTIRIEGENGKRNKEVTIKQKQIVYYSPKYAKRCKELREQQLEKVRKLLHGETSYTNATNYGALGYIKETVIEQSTGEAKKKAVIKGNPNTGNILLHIDEDKVAEEEKYDGYYSIVTSEVNLEDIEVIKKYRGLWKIEESFKITKSELQARPIYLSREERIESHFFICFLSLVILRIIEHRIQREYSPKQIIKSLRKCEMIHLKENQYQCIYRDAIIEKLDEIYGIETQYKYRSLQQIKKVLAEVKKQK